MLNQLSEPTGRWLKISLLLFLVFFFVKGESKSRTQSASFEVSRERGTFGTVDVTWSVTAGSGADPSLDVDPTYGHVMFSPGDTSKFITINSVADKVSIYFSRRLVIFLRTSNLRPRFEVKRLPSEEQMILDIYQDVSLLNHEKGRKLPFLF